LYTRRVVLDDDGSVDHAATCPGCPSVLIPKSVSWLAVHFTCGQPSRFRNQWLQHFVLVCPFSSLLTVAGPLRIFTVFRFFRYHASVVNTVFGLHHSACQGAGTIVVCQYSGWHYNLFTLTQSIKVRISNLSNTKNNWICCRSVAMSVISCACYSLSRVRKS